MSCPATTLVERQLQQLGDLAEIGLEIARAVEARVKAAGPQDDLTPFAVAYARVARAVRLAILLQSKLLEVRKVAQDRERYARGKALDLQKARVEREVERAAKAAHDGDDAEVDRLMTETGDRLDLEDYGDILDRPVGEVVALICRDLGLPFDPSAFDPPYLPHEAAGGGPLAEERAVEGATLLHFPSFASDDEARFCGPLAPSAIGSSADGSPPAASGGGGRMPPPPS